ncbi:MAG: hypothetical protein JKY56_04735 [Kofleriaceae bacterium]|nr:hypothetical protein [Kofleriaceae bacterium]
MFRFLASLLFLLGVSQGISGCELSANSERANDDDPNDSPEPGDGGGGGGGGAPVQANCELPSACVLAASTCCECPSFAVPSSDGFVDSCEDVDCEASEICPAVVASCDGNQCQVACAAVATEAQCEFGFVRDSAGCLLDECVSGFSLIACEQASDCQQIPSDCCGCARGGRDQAVLASDAAAVAKGLACTGQESCPEIDVCDSTESPQCVAGACVLTTSDTTDIPPSVTLCGTLALGPCSDGFTCLLNYAAEETASALGVGVCVESP